jgi:hypothetical protein
MLDIDPPIASRQVYKYIPVPCVLHCTRGQEQDKFFSGQILDASTAFNCGLVLLSTYASFHQLPHMQTYKSEQLQTKLASQPYPRSDQAGEGDEWVLQPGVVVSAVAAGNKVRR